MKKTLVLPLVLLLLSSFACNLASRTQTTPTPDVAAMVNATLTAIAAQVTPVPPTAEPSATPEPARDFIPPTGFISGKLSYPSEFIPPLRIVAFNMHDNSTAYMETALNQSEYTFELPVGEWAVVAYVVSPGGIPGMAGGYSSAVPCGLGAECTDHGLIIVTVKAGETITGVDLTDWYAPEGAFPDMP